jgi:glycine betaine/choline ABC-type transport system substrate-binding protein
MKKRKKTMNFGKFKDADTFTYWVNKKTGTTHMVRADVDWSGDLKLSTTTLNLRYERDYFFRKDAVARFLKNYDFVCENATNEFYVNVLANKQLKSELSWGLKTKGRLGITRDEFFNKVKGEA